MVNNKEVDRWLLRACDGEDGLKEILNEVYGATNIDMAPDTFVEVARMVAEDWENREKNLKENRS